MRDPSDPWLSAVPLRAATHELNVWTGNRLQVMLRVDLAIVLLAIRRGRRAGVAKQLMQAFNVTLPSTRRLTRSADMSLLDCGRDRYLVTAPLEFCGARIDRLRELLKEDAAITDQSDQLTVFSIQGSAARAVLARYCALDFEPAEFPPGTSVVTRFDDLTMHLWQPDDSAGYFMGVERSYASSLRETLVECGRQLGASEP